MEDKDLFEPGQVNYILRTYLPYWRYEERIEEMIRFCRETGTRHVMLFTDAQHMVWNQLTLEEARREANNIKRAIKRLAEEGIRVGINSTYNMPKCRWDHRSHNDYDYWVTAADGSCEYKVPCLLDPKLEIYLKNFYTILAETGPEYIYIDDDHRYVLLGQKGIWGCFCELHLKKFGEITKTSWSREKLYEALLNDERIRKYWIEFLGKRLVEIGELIRKSVHAVNPDIVVGMMVPSVHPLPVMGHTIKNVLKALHPAEKPLVRPPIGPYSDRDRRQIIPGLFYLEFTGHLLGEDIQYTPEIETTPFTRFSKSMTVVRFHITQGILNRMNNPAISVCGYVGDSPYFEPAFVELLRDNRDYFEGVRRIAPERGTRKGIQFIWDFESAKKRPGRIKNVEELFWPAFTCHDILGNLGFPITYDESPVKFLAGDSVRAFSPERISEILRGGLVLDAYAAQALVDLGYEEFIGCKVGENVTGFGAEECISQEYCGDYVNTYIPLQRVRTDAVYKLVLKTGVEKITVITDNNREEIAPGVILFENRLGGKIAVLPYSILGVENDLRHFICYQRQYMLKKIFQWMSPGVVRVLVEYPADFAVQVWEDERKMTVCITNISYDVIDNITLRIFDSKVSPEKTYFLGDDGKLYPLKEHIKDISLADETRWEVNHTFTIFRPFIMLLEKGVEV